MSKIVLTQQRGQNVCRNTGAIYFSSVVEVAMDCSFFESQDIAQPCNMKAYPATERHVLRQQV